MCLLVFPSSLRQCDIHTVTRKMTEAHRANESCCFSFTPICMQGRICCSCTGLSMSLILGLGKNYQQHVNEYNSFKRCCLSVFLSFFFSVFLSSFLSFCCYSHPQPLFSAVCFCLHPSLSELFLSTPISD